MMSVPLSPPPALISLHRYYIWANKIRTHFDELLSEQEPRRAGWDIEANLYMSYWYAGLFVVIEGWRKLQLRDSAIDPLLTSQNVDLLKRYRNGVFHFQSDYHDERFLGFIRDGQDAVAWVRALNQEFGRYFLERLRSNAASNTTT